MADQVMRMTEPRALRMCGDCEEEVRRQPDEGDEEERLQAREVRGRTPELPPGLEARIAARRGGQPLPAPLRSFFEPRFGAGFGHVRVHADPEARRTADRIQARAFTYGSHIWLGKGESRDDRGLMAHELAHVVQQTGSAPPDATGPGGPAPRAGEDRVQRARLPCTRRTTVQVYGVNLPGSTRSLNDDLANANSVLCQCGIEVKSAGGQSWSTGVLDLDTPHGVLNHSTSTATREVQQMTAHRPGGDVIHAYYVPSNSIRSRGSAFYASRYGGRFPGTVPSVAMTDSAAVDTFAHELGHVLMDEGGHHADADNLMASGGSRNVGVDELERSQCTRMP